MIEFSNLAKKRLVKMLLGSAAIDNFISDAMAIALKLQVQDDEDFHEVTLANGIVMPIAGYVQFVMNCGDYEGKIMTRVFLNLHKKYILGMPWVEYKNPIIDWTQGQVTIKRPSCILTLLVVQRQQVKPSIEAVNLYSAKQEAQWFCRRNVDEADLAFI